MDIQASAVKLLEGAVQLMTADLGAMPEEMFSRRFGGKARTVADIVYEVMLVNDHVGRTIRGEELFEWPEGGWITAPEGFAGKEHILAQFKESCEMILATGKSLSEADLLGNVTTEHGETTRFERCQFIALHMWYHSGQFNYIQTLAGDDGWHWG